jgi:hypothetical protein
MESSKDNRLFNALESLRAAPRQEFAAALDERVAAGFPGHPQRGDSPLHRAVARLRTVPPRRLVLSGGGIVVATIVIGTTIIAANESGSGPSAFRSQPRVIQFAGQRPAHEAGEEALGPSGEVKLPPAVPTEGAAAASVGRYRAGELFRPGGHRRDVERAAEIVLGTTPSEVHEVANRVLRTVHTFRGIVLRSSIHEVGDADSTFDLLIPSSRLSDALAGFSEAGEVLSRSESTADVTARAIGLGEQLRDAEATVKGLLGQLAAAESDSEREVAEVELRAARKHAAGLRSRLGSLQRHVHFSRVSLRIDSKPGAVTGTSHWGPSDALHDAGHILTIAAGVVIVGLAVVVPLALITLLAWLARRAWVRRGRERALSAQSP